MRRHSSLRFSALVALLALSGALGHVHGPHHGAHADDAKTIENAASGGAPTPLAATAERPNASSDDAHHEHSSGTSLERTLCLACRSQGEDEAIPARAAGPTLAVSRPARALAPPVARTRPSRGRPGGPRAPPDAAA